MTSGDRVYLNTARDGVPAWASGVILSLGKGRTATVRFSYENTTAVLVCSLDELRFYHLREQALVIKLMLIWVIGFVGLIVWRPLWGEVFYTISFAALVVYAAVFLKTVLDRKSYTSLQKAEFLAWRFTIISINLGLLGVLGLFMMVISLWYILVPITVAWYGLFVTWFLLD